MHPHVMVVEDEEALSEMLRYNLEAEGYEVEVVDRGDDAEIRLRETVPDLLLLDWMLPGLSGIELCRRVRLRSETETLPIIMLTARSEEAERVRGLSTGADDFVVKPFSIPEDIELDREMHRAHRNGREMRLGPTEYKLLEFLMSAPGRVFSREQLLDGVWGNDNYVDERTVDVHIGRLRRSITRGKEKDPIRTVRGAGYSLNDKFV